MLRDQLEDVESSDIGESRADEDVMANIVDSSREVLQDEQRLVARQRQLTGVVRRIPALQEGKGHGRADTLGGSRILSHYRATPSVTVSCISYYRHLAGSLGAQSGLPGAALNYRPLRDFSNSSPACHCTKSGCEATCQPRAKPKRASLASAVKSMFSLYSSEG